jgi:hypothetical protein
MRCVEAQHSFEVAAAEDQQPVETLGADGADEALGIEAFARGARTGVWITSIASLRKTSSNAALNLLSRSWIRKAHPLVQAGEDCGRGAEDERLE